MQSHPLCWLHNQNGPMVLVLHPILSPIVGKQKPNVSSPLSTNDDYSRHRKTAACYQLVQSVLKIGSVLAERVGQGEVGGYTVLADSAWRLLQLTIEWARSALGGPLFCFLVQTSVESGPFTCRGSISGSFQSGGTFLGQRTLTIECSVMSGCGQGHEPAKNFQRKLWIKFLGLTPSRSGNTSERRWD